MMSSAKPCGRRSILRPFFVVLRTPRKLPIRQNWHMENVYLDAIVIGHPRAQTRPHVYRNRGKICVQTDSKVCADWKAAIVASIIETGFNNPAEGAPLHLELELAMPTVQSKRFGLWATSRPDIDNLAKAAADALMKPEGSDFAAAVRKIPGEKNYDGVIKDDSVIVSTRVTKKWSARPGGARIILRDV